MGLEAERRMIELKIENKTAEARDAQAEALTGKSVDQVDPKSLVAREVEAEAVTPKNARHQETDIAEETTAKGTLVVNALETEESQTLSRKKSPRTLSQEVPGRSRSREKIALQ